MTREAAIARLRRTLMSFCAEGESACRAAADHQLLCRGFGHMTDAQLRLRFGEILHLPPDAPRDVIEAKANEWLLARQQATAAPTICDLQRRTHETCRGWDEFSNAELAKYCGEMLELDAIVVGPEFGSVRREARSGQ